MDTDLDTLATALFVKTGELLNSSPQLAPWRPRHITGQVIAVNGGARTTR